MKNEAAAVILMKENKILGFMRADVGEYGLPCGKVKPPESASHAALRELQEETGHIAKLIGSRRYTAYDSAGKHVVSCYLVKSIAEVQPTTPDEGYAEWVSPIDLTIGPYGHYNERAFKFFGIDPYPLAGKFHSHITMNVTDEYQAEAARELVGGKVTVINLEREDRKQVDMMLTHHYVTGKGPLRDYHDVVELLKRHGARLKEKGFEVTRLKLEHEPFDNRSPYQCIQSSFTDYEYIEVHVKVVVTGAHELMLLKQEAAEMGWHPSNNPFAKTKDGKLVQFLNRRWYKHEDENDPNAVEAATETLVHNISHMITELKEIKYESAVYDSNINLDKWWMMS